MKLTRIFQKVFGQNAGANQIGKFGSLAAGSPETVTDPADVQDLANFMNGWYSAVVGNNSPAIQDMNGLFFLAFRQIAYILQQGIAEWDSETEYYKENFVAFEGDIYFSLKDENLNNNPSDPFSWKSLTGTIKEQITLMCTSNFSRHEMGEGLESFWRGIAYGNETYVAVASAIDTGFSSFVGTSKDGKSWQGQSIAEDYRDVAFGDSLFVAVRNGFESNVRTSADGESWTSRSLPETFNTRSITYGNGLFVSVAHFGATSAIEGEKAMTSPDGITWTERDTQGGNWESVVYGNGLFVAVASDGTNRSMYSSDGITWESGDLPNQSWESVTYGKGLFVAISSDGSDRIAISENGEEWTLVSSSIQPNLITFGDGVFVLVDEDKKVYQSLDGEEWKCSNIFKNASAIDVNCISFGGGRFVALGVGDSGDDLYRSALLDTTGPNNGNFNKEFASGDFLVERKGNLLSIGATGTIGHEETAFAQSDDGFLPVWCIIPGGLWIENVYTTSSRLGSMRVYNDRSLLLGYRNFTDSVGGPSAQSEHVTSGVPPSGSFVLEPITVGYSFVSLSNGV